MHKRMAQQQPSSLSIAINVICYCRSLIIVLPSVPIELYIYIFISLSLYLAHYFLWIGAPLQAACRCHSQHTSLHLILLICFGVLVRFGEMEKYEKLKSIYLHENNEIKVNRATLMLLHFHPLLLHFSRLLKCQASLKKCDQNEKGWNLWWKKCAHVKGSQFQDDVFSKLNPY